MHYALFKLYLYFLCSFVNQFLTVQLNSYRLLLILCIILISLGQILISAFVVTIPFHIRSGMVQLYYSLDCTFYTSKMFCIRIIDTYVSA